MNASLSIAVRSTVYHLKKEYGTVVQYRVARKGDVNLDTGKRDPATDFVFPLACVMVPTGVTMESLLRVTGGKLGDVPEYSAQFLVLAEDFLVGTKNPHQVPSDQDSFVHGNVRYEIVNIDVYGDAAYGLTGEGSS